MSATKLDNPIRFTGIVISLTSPFYTGHALLKLLVVVAGGSIILPKSVSSWTCQHSPLRTMSFNSDTKIFCCIAISSCTDNIGVINDYTVGFRRNNLVLRYKKAYKDNDT